MHPFAQLARSHPYALRFLLFIPLLLLPTVAFGLSNPVLVGSASTGNAPDSVSVQGSYAYVTNQSSDSLQIFDVSSPANPTLVASTSTVAGPTSVFVQGNYAYVTISSKTTHGLLIFNISNPT